MEKLNRRKIIRTGSAQIDEQLLVTYDGAPLGGLPNGALIELQGGPSAGVTTFCMALLRQLSLWEPAGSALWVDGDFAMTNGVGPALCEDWGVTSGVRFLTPPVDKRLGWAMRIIEEASPLADVTIVDRIDGLIADYPEEKYELETLIAVAARVAHENNILIIGCTGQWYSHKVRDVITAGERPFRQYASLGLTLLRPGWIEVSYSRVTRYPRQVRYEYASDIAKRLPEISVLDELK